MRKIINTRKRYSPAFKAKLVARLSEPGAISAHMLAKETGVTQSSLSRWLRDSLEQLPLEGLSVVGNSGRKKEWTLHEKIRVLGQADLLSEAELGAFLRQAGVHPEELRSWRESLQESRIDRSAQRRIRALERELRRKDKALAEAAALLLLKKKAQALGLLAAEDDDTGETRGS